MVQGCSLIGACLHLVQVTWKRSRTAKTLKSAKKLFVDYCFEKVQKLKFSMYDIDNKSFDLKDDDYLGGIGCMLGQGKGLEVGTSHYPIGDKVGVEQSWITFRSSRKTKTDAGGSSVFPCKLSVVEILINLSSDVANIFSPDGEFTSIDAELSDRRWGSELWPVPLMQDVCPLPVPFYFQISPEAQLVSDNVCVGVGHSSENSSHLVWLTRGEQSFQGVLVLVIQSRIETEYSFLDCVVEAARFTLHPHGINEYLIAIWSVGNVVQDYDLFVMNLTDENVSQYVGLAQMVKAS
ncbi:hypothetical protein DUI87_27612 [Hirundo rustica rustica]|uniref:Uncharacterized protein n=1 Tax=Hirundo rustica rustica TaxID=333673 RepID=A0A3M0J9E4_HIRRU|nr:hypothetical protein DUI87_27612 [Hirundo rustica rustica]